MRPADSDSGEAAPSSEEYTAVASVADTSTKKKMCKIKNEDDDQKLFKGISKKVILLFSIPIEMCFY